MKNEIIEKMQMSFRFMLLAYYYKYNISIRHEVNLAVYCF